MCGHLGIRSGLLYGYVGLLGGVWNSNKHSCIKVVVKSFSIIVKLFWDGVQVFWVTNYDPTIPGEGVQDEASRSSWFDPFSNGA